MNKEKILVKDSDLEFPHIYAIEASAGAGKTTCLTQRYLQFLFSKKINTKFQNISAITFTNKAANEMKKRILESLKKIALGSSEDISKILPLVSTDENTIMKEAEKTIEEILLHYTDLNIGTIDSFINSIIRSSAIESGITPDFEITMQPDVLVEYAVDILLEKLQNSDSLRQDFDDFLHSYLTIEERSGWYPKIKLLERINLLRKKENEKGFTFLIHQGTNIKLEQIIKSMENFLKECQKFKLPLVVNAQRGIRKFIDSHDTNSVYLMHDDAQKLFLKNSIIPDEIKKMWLDIRKNLEEYYKNKAVSIFYPYLNLQKRVKKTLEDIKYQKGVLFIDELNTYVKNLIENFKVPYIYYKLGEQIRHYLIDEFQDTNEIQWKNIFHLVQNSLSEGGSLFYVGDKKQAIYRFRGGNSELFDEVISEKKLTAITRQVYNKKISENMRSREAIVNFNNKLFSIENLSKIAQNSKDDTDTNIFTRMLQKTYSNIQQKVPENLKDTRRGGFVFIKSFRQSKDQSLTNEEIEDIIKEQLLKDILNLLSRKISDIAVLVRKTEEVETVTGWLLEKGIETVSETAGDLREHPLICEVISFLKFLNDPLDELSFVSFICGDIFTSKTQLKRGEIYEWVNQLKEKNGILYQKFKEWKNNLWNNYIDYFFKNIGFLPVYDLIIHFFDRFDVFLTFKDSGGFLIHFLETIRKMEEIGENNIEQIIDNWEKKDNEEIFTVPLNVQSGAVNVMTMHKAKGLQFSAVILPFAGVVSKNVTEIFLNDTNEIAFTNKEIRELNREINVACTIEKTKQSIDEINIFYVGCTRAKDELYIYAPPKIGTSTNTLMNIYPFSEYSELEIGEKLKSEGTDKNLSTRRKVMEFLSLPIKSDWAERFVGLTSREKLLDSLYSKDNPQIKIGNLIHKILSTIYTFDESKLKQKIDSLNESEELKKELEEKLKQMASSESLRRYFLLDNDARVYREVEVINEHGDIRRIDRLVINKTSVAVLDFKTGKSENISGDRRQINDYMEIIRKIYPEKTTIGLIVYIDPFKVIEVV